MPELSDYIQSYFPVAPNELSVISTQFTTLHLNKGDFFGKEERVCNRLAFIQSGLIRIFKNMDGKEVTQWISSEGYFITDLESFVFDTPGRWQMQALTDCVLFSIDKQAYRALSKTVPRWAELDKLFIARCFVMLENRIFSHLYMSAEERFQELIERSPELFNQVPLQYLASMLGMTPETLSRLRNKRQ